MPQTKLLLKPGIDSQSTQTLNSLGWFDSNLMRWRYGLPEKLGGWQALSSTPVVGTCRCLHGFDDLLRNSYLGIGTNSRLQLYYSGGIIDITPIRQTNNLTTAFSTTISSTTVQITDVANGSAAGDWINILTYYAVGGIVLYGFYEIDTIIDSDNYTIIAADAATSTVSSGGTTSEFTTVNTSATVTVTLVNHGLTAGDVYTVNVSTSVGGLTLSGDYLVITVVDADNFTIAAASAATSSTTGFENGGDARVEYLLSSGLVSTTALTGYGTGAYGSGGYGVSSSSSGSTPLRIWSIDNFGQIMMAVPSNGALYAWTPPTSSGNVATVVSQAPNANVGMFVAMPQRQVVLLGSVDPDTGDQDNLFIRWSDVDDYTVWTAASTNQAGSFRLSRGSTIVGGCQAPQAGLIWTDEDLWAMQYIGYPNIYSLSIIGNGCGLIGNKAFATIGRNTYWLSTRGVFIYGDSGVQPISCPVWDKVFGDLDTANQDKCLAASDTLSNEVFFFYPSASGGTGEIDSYVKVNVVEGLWDCGTLERTAWVDVNPFGSPIGVDGSNLLEQHEMGYDANGAAMSGVYLESGYTDIAEGTLFVFVDQIIPDFYMTGSSASVQMTVYATNYPGDMPKTFGPYTVTSSTEYIPLRVRARQLAFKIQCDALGTFFRVGAIRYRGAPAGRR